MTSLAQKRSDFRKLHEAGCFVIPNPWDVGSAMLLRSLGFKALASTSAGFAWSVGRTDYGLKREDVLQHLAVLSAATDLPVNADYENGFADSPEDVAASVTQCVATGVSGLSIENRTNNPKQPLYDDALAVERIRASRRAIDATGTDVLLVARCEGFLVGQPDLAATIKRLQAFAEAGADCLYPPGISTKEQVAAVVKAVAPKPVNILIGGKTDLTVPVLADLGVRRVSLGGALARAAWGGFMRAAIEIRDKGTFNELGNGHPGGELQKIFAGARAVSQAG
jgi:2-methylisocitrate lyase-like PEP mutase family enzyme